LCKLFNESREDQQEERRHVLAELFGRRTDVWIQPPFFCDCGTNISLGEKVFFNFNCVVLDVMQVAIGSNVLFGPAWNWPGPSRWGPTSGSEAGRSSALVLRWASGP
jgi:maltose O-acetyltransferase